MRAIGGLVGLLVCIAIGVWIWSINATQAVKQSEPARRQAEKLAGVDAQGNRVQDSIELDAQASPSGKVNHIFVNRINADGPMATHFGLKQNDKIVAVNKMKVRDYDAEIMKAWILEARGRDWEITVMRDDQEVNLPQAKSTTPGTPPPSENSNKSPLGRQLDNIPGVQK